MGFTCLDCGAATDPTPTCPKCGGFVEYAANRESLRLAVEGDPAAALPPFERIRMGEGNTPLVDLAETPSTVSGKIESLNPTLSFKDRGSALLASAVADSDTPWNAVVVASTGNTATSVAAYAARVGCPCAVLVPADTPTSKLGHAAAYGAAVFTIEGTFSDCFDLAEQVAGEHVVNGTAVYSANPFVASANRTVAFEIVAAIGVPDWVSVPVGAGPLLGGTFHGFRELHEAGITDDVPRMLAVQAHGCHPVVRGFERGEPVKPWTDPITTEVGAIADPLVGYPADGEHTRQAVEESGGTAVALNDDVVFEWADKLATSGLYAESASAASVAGIEAAGVSADETAVALVTGHGVNEPREGTVETTAIPLDPEPVREVLR